MALIGPTGSGKTALAASAVATWDGPAVVVSVKRDLYDVTVAARADKGELAVFDPAASTGLPSARWSPLQRVGTAGEALRTGRALAQAIPRNGVTGADYWAKHGESLLGVVHVRRRLVAARRAGGRGWCRAGEHAADRDVGVDGGDGNGPGDQQRCFAGVLEDDQPPRVQLMARHAASAFIGLSREDDRIRSSIYATARLAVENRGWSRRWRIRRPPILASSTTSAASGSSPRGSSTWSG